MKVEHKSEHLLATYSEMANLLRCTERHLANLVSLGVVPSIRMGKAVRFDPADVIAALKAQASGAKGSAPSTSDSPATDADTVSRPIPD